MASRRRAGRRIGAVGAITTLLAVVVVLAVTGTREPASALRLLSGEAWLGNQKPGTVTHVDGYGGTATSQVGVVRPGDPFTVVQEPDGAFILDTRTGTLTRVSDDGVTPKVTAQMQGSPAALQIISTPGVSWVLDRESGVLRQLNPATLLAQGPAIPLGQATGTAMADTSGDLWIPIPGRGVIDEVIPGDGASVQSHPLGQPGDSIAVAVTSDGVWGIDPQAGKAASLSDPSAPQIHLPQFPAGQQPVVATSGANAQIVILDGSQVLDANTANSSVSSVSSPSYAAASQAVISQNQAFLLDSAAHQLDVLNLAPLAAVAPVTVPVGSDQLVAQDELVFVNNTESPQAVVINANGQVTPISKYQPATPATPDAVPDPLATPPPANQSPLDYPTPGPPTGPSAPSGSPATTPPTIPVQTTPTTPAAGPTTTTVPVTTTTLPTPPGAPKITSATAGTTTFDVAWTAPASTGSSAIASYEVSLTGGGKTTQASVSAATKTFSGLGEGVQYCAEVQAVGANGKAGVASSQACATTIAKPGAFTLTVTTGDAGELDASWTAASGATSYTVSDGGAAKAATGTSATFSGLAVQSYTITVTATDAAGTDTASASGTPFGRATAYECENVDHNDEEWVDIPVDGNECGSAFSDSAVVLENTYPWGWDAGGVAPTGSVQLSFQQVTVGANDDGFFYSIPGSSETVGNGGVSGSLSHLGLVFTSSPGPTSTHLCQALSHANNSIYLLYVDGQQPGGEACELTFWT